MLDLSKIDLSEYDIKRKLRLPKKLSNDLAYLCGVLAGDGHISKDYGNKCRNTIYCSGNPKDEIEYYDQIIVPLFFKLFNIKIKAKYFTDGTYGIRFDSKAIVQFLTKILNFSRGKKYNKLNIPQRFKKNKYLKLAFVRGLFDTDFGFCLCKKYKKDPYYPQLCFVSKSERFAKEIWKALKEFGIKFDGKVYRVLDKDNRAKSGFTITYRFDLYGHKYLINIIKVIKIRHPKHIKKFKEWTLINKNNPKVMKLLIKK